MKKILLRLNDELAQKLTTTQQEFTRLWGRKVSQASMIEWCLYRGIKVMNYDLSQQEVGSAFCMKGSNHESI